MSIESGGTYNFIEWKVDPFEELYRLWKAINQGLELGIPHLVGKARVKDGKVVGLEMDVILHEREEYLSFRDGDEIYFVIPARPEEGIEGIYVKLNKILGEAR